MPRARKGAGAPTPSAPVQLAPAFDIARAAQLDPASMGDLVTPLGVVVGGAPRKHAPTPALHPVALGLVRHSAVPTYQSVSSFAPVQVPNPPLLDERDIDGRKAYLLQRWFEGAVESRLKTRCWSFKSERVSHITKSKHFATLVKAVAVFQEHEIAPAAWCAFSVDVWLEFNDGKKRPPPIDWVFSPKRIEERRGWFRGSESDYRGGLLIFSDLAKDFMRRQGCMLAAVGRIPATATDEDIVRTVATYFPGDKYQQMISQIKAEAQEANDALAERIYLGQWVWE